MGSAFNLTLFLLTLSTTAKRLFWSHTVVINCSVLNDKCLRSGTTLSLSCLSTVHRQLGWDCSILADKPLYKARAFEITRFMESSHRIPDLDGHNRAGFTCARSAGPPAGPK